jgi:hypothetical protein
MAHMVMVMATNGVQVLTLSSSIFVEILIRIFTPSSHLGPFHRSPTPATTTVDVAVRRPPAQPTLPPNRRKNSLSNLRRWNSFSFTGRTGEDGPCHLQRRRGLRPWMAPLAGKGHGGAWQQRSSNAGSARGKDNSSPSHR